MKVAVLIVAGLIGWATSIAVGSEIQASNEPLVYNLKPDFTYFYEFELRSGEDGDGFLQLDGSVTYRLAPGTARPSLIDEAFSDVDDEDQISGKPFEVQVQEIVNTKMLPGQFVDGTIRITPRGNTIKLLESDYSIVSTTVGLLAFDELPPSKQTKWESTRNRKLVFIEEQSAGLPDRFSMLRYGRYAPLLPESRQLQPTTRNQMDVEEKCTYELVTLTAEKAVVKTQLVSSWVGVTTGKTAVELLSTGQYVFDRQQNVISKGRSQSELKVKSEGIEAKLPFKMAFALKEIVSADEMKERAVKQEANRKKAEADRQQALELRISKAIADLKDASSKPTDVQAALSTLASARRNVAKPEREEVAILLNKFLESEDERIRSEAVRVAQEWGTQENIPALLELLKTSKSYRRGNIIEALGTTGGNSNVATILVRLLESTNTRFHASRALQMMGAVGEPAVLPLLKSSEREMRDEACRILGEIGGKQSKAALEAVLAETKEDDIHRFVVKSSLDKVNERLAANPD